MVRTIIRIAANLAAIWLSYRYVLPQFGEAWFLLLIAFVTIIFTCIGKHNIDGKLIVDKSGATKDVYSVVIYRPLDGIEHEREITLRVVSGHALDYSLDRTPDASSGQVDKLE